MRVNYLCVFILVVGCFSVQAQLTNGTGWVNGYYIGPGEDLQGADLSHADLSTANLSNANLSGANLSNANLSYVNFSGAILIGANVSGTYLGFFSASEMDTMDFLNTQIVALSGTVISNYNLPGHAGGRLYAVTNGAVTIQFLMDESTNLVDWVSITNTSTVVVPADQGTSFFHFKND